MGIKEFQAWGPPGGPASCFSSVEGIQDLVKRDLLEPDYIHLFSIQAMSHLNTMQQCYRIRGWGDLDIPSLIDALKSTNAEARSRAITTLGDLKEAQALDPAIAVLTEQADPSIRWGAIQLLWRLGDARALPSLLTALTDKNEIVRRAAAYGLGQLGDARAISALIAAFQDEIKGVRIAASLAADPF